MPECGAQQALYSIEYDCQTRIVLLIPFLIGSAWLHAAAVLALARHEGIYASHGEGMRAPIAHRWSSVERIEIDYAGPNDRDKRDPHI